MNMSWNNLIYKWRMYGNMNYIRLITVIIILVVVTSCVQAPAPTPVPEPAPTPDIKPDSISPPVADDKDLMPDVDIPIIDAHSQFCPENIDQVVPLMDLGGVACTILSAGVTSSSGVVKPEELISLSLNNPGRIIPAVKTKGRAYNDNSETYYEQLKYQVETGKYGAMAEVLMYHAQKGVQTRKVPEIIVYPDDIRVSTALEYALDNKWPFVVHIEFAAAGNRRDKFMVKLEDLLVKHPQHPFALIHMGQLDHSEARRLIETHQNINFITSHSSPITVSKSRQPWTNLFDGNSLSDDWKQLFIDYPGRFIMGFDMVWYWDWDEIYLPQIKLWREAMAELPFEVAHALAHGNSERLWHIPPLK